MIQRFAVCHQKPDLQLHNYHLHKGPAWIRKFNSMQRCVCMYIYRVPRRWPRSNFWNPVAGAIQNSINENLQFHCVGQTSLLGFNARTCSLRGNEAWKKSMIRELISRDTKRFVLRLSDPPDIFDLEQQKHFFSISVSQSKRLAGFIGRWSIGRILRGCYRNWYPQRVFSETKEKRASSPSKIVPSRVLRDCLYPLGANHCLN